ncbi:transcriptional repressor LexA [Brevibacterium sp. 50QC2O2]|jgi:repressor LexA|uniref:transcriptional repressor LexA n=1 Tax=Brevibacterium TaxID=1696 RepID=UPI00211C6BFD|nr:MULTISPECIES: transcriptional repressor LexA [unclassified Brevibacterium]MCQ9369332.1 transcriptional repressor LexA [Brevibacterium sp. 91QC2O2]MCQ9385007.1 transcriptional repressor LexA [Brevibacterium sp. 68QC2CO]MCQ9387945.1 transcriptional repressor LexA [Brevibacterium sp. 50QC2O2]
MTAAQRRPRGRPRNDSVEDELREFRDRAGHGETGSQSAAADDRRLTARQRVVLETIEQAIVANGYPPSMREIGEACGLASLSSVAHQLTQLERLGYIRRDPRRPRALEVVNPAEQKLAAEIHSTAELNTSLVPLVGRIAAGGPITAEQNVDDVFALPRQVVGSGELFLLQVIGDSMIDAAICNGDYVVVRRQSNAENGQIIAALLDDEATVKTLKRTGGKQWLMPHNPAYEPIDGDHATIMGIVTAVIRSI